MMDVALMCYYSRFHRHEKAPSTRAYQDKAPLPAAGMFLETNAGPKTGRDPPSKPVGGAKATKAALPPANV